MWPGCEIICGLEVNARGCAQDVKEPQSRTALLSKTYRSDGAAVVPTLLSEVNVLDMFVYEATDGP